MITNPEGAVFDGEYFGHFDAVASFNLLNYDSKYIVKGKGASRHVTSTEYAGLAGSDGVRNLLMT